MKSLLPLLAVLVCAGAAGIISAAKPPRKAPPAPSATTPSPTPPPALAERASLALARDKAACSCTMNEALAEAILASPE